MFRNYVIMPKVTMFYETQWLLAETCWCSFIPHLSAPLFVFHCPENRLQPAPPAQQGEDEIFLSWTQHFLSSNSGVLAGKLNGENVWILQISILSSHQLDRMKMEPFSGSRFTLVIALRGTHDAKIYGFCKSRHGLVNQEWKSPTFATEVKIGLEKPDFFASWTMWLREPPC